MKGLSLQANCRIQLCKKLVSRYAYPLAIASGIALGILGEAIAPLPAQAAERIQFFFGPFEPTLYVEDLETFAETGDVPERLQPFARRLSEPQKQSLRGFLNAKAELSPIPVAQFTYSSLGESLLGKLGQVVQTDSFLNGMKGLRSALILAAADEEQGGLTTLNAMRHFPTETIQIDFSLARQIAAENEEIFMRRDSAVEAIRQHARTQAMDKNKLSLENDPRRAGASAWQVETFSFRTSGRTATSIADLYVPDRADAAAEDNAFSIPVVVISHGVASSRSTFAYMAEHLASHGYAVVAIEHRETSAEKFVRFLWGKEGAPGGEELLLRTQDITAVLDVLSERQAAGEPALSGLNLTSVGLLGQSLGGYTVLAAGGAQIDRAYLAAECESSLAERPTLNLSMLTQCTLLDLPAGTLMDFADERVAAVVALNPLTSSIFGRSGLQEIEIPVMIVAGTDDYVAPALPEQIEPFDWLTTEHKKLVVMNKGTHFSFLDRNSQDALPFSDGLMGPDPTAARAPTRALSLAFFDRHLQGRAEAEQFLNQAYLDEFPKEPFEFSVVDSLPE
ncbi:MAG: alpha/beta hydrolase [Cyanobacteria bacterium J06606_4]